MIYFTIYICAFSTCKICSDTKSLFVMTQIWDIIPLGSMHMAQINNWNVGVSTKTSSLICFNVWVLFTSKESWREQPNDSRTNHEENVSGAVLDARCFHLATQHFMVKKVLGNLQRTPYMLLFVERENLCTFMCSLSAWQNPSQCSVV